MPVMIWIWIMILLAIAMATVWIVFFECWLREIEREESQNRSARDTLKNDIMSEWKSQRH